MSLRRDISLSHNKYDRKHLCPNRENETYVESTCILKNKELYKLKNVARSIKTPTGYGSSLYKSFTIDGHITKFKTHDFHNFMKVLYLII